MIENKKNAGIEKDEAVVYKLKLYITGSTPNSIRAISNTKNFCEAHLKNKYDLEIIDVYQEPELAAKQQIIALPILIKITPLPLRRLIGDMSDEDKMFRGLGL